jgi:hypothetical protein
LTRAALQRSNLRRTIVLVCFTVGFSFAIAQAQADPPTAATGSAQVHQDGSVTLTGTLSSNSNFGVRYYFSWESRTEWRHRPGRYPSEWDTVATAGDGLSISQTIPGNNFDPGTLYHYELVAWNGDTFGVVEGGDQTFMTAGQGPDSGGGGQQTHNGSTGPWSPSAPGPATSAVPPPKGPCTIQSEVGTLDLGATLLSGSAGTNFTATVTHTSDGRFEASVTNAAKFGFEPGSGFEASSGTGSGASDEHGVAANLKGGLTVQDVQGTTYEAASEDDADQVIGARLDEIMGAIPILGVFAEKSTYPLGPPIKAERGLEAEGHLDRELGLTGVGQGKISGAFTGFEREEVDARDRTKTQFIGLALSADGGIDGLGHVKVNGKAEGGITTDANTDTPTRATVTIRYAGSLAGTPDVTFKDPKQVYSALTKAVANGESSAGTETDIRASIDLHPPANLQAFRNFVSGGIGSLTAHGRALFDIAAQESGITVLTYDVSRYGTGASARGGEGVEFGGTAATSDTTAKLATAGYYVPGVGLVTWAQCLDAAKKNP